MCNCSQFSIRTEKYHLWLEARRLRQQLCKQTQTQTHKHSKVNHGCFSSVCVSHSWTSSHLRTFNILTNILTYDNKSLWKAVKCDKSRCHLENYKKPAIIILLCVSLSNSLIEFQPLFITVIIVTEGFTS